MNSIITSSRDFVVKFARSKKLSVDIGRDEKKLCDGRLVGVGLGSGCRVRSIVRSSVTIVLVTVSWLIWKYLTL